MINLLRLEFQGLDDRWHFQSHNVKEMHRFFIECAGLTDDPFRYRQFRFHNFKLTLKLFYLTAGGIQYQNIVARLTGKK